MNSTPRRTSSSDTYLASRLFSTRDRVTWSASSRAACAATCARNEVLNGERMVSRQVATSLRVTAYPMRIPARPWILEKVHGLAGMRIGYAVTLREVATCLETIRSPFNTSFLAQVAAHAALEDADHVTRSRVENSREARYVSDELVRRGVEFIPTVANFLLVKTNIAGAEMYQRLLRLGVIVRPMEPYG